MAKRISDVIDYFSDLCVQHPDLAHDEASGSRVFEFILYEDAFGDFRTAASEKGYFVRLLMPTATFSNHQNNAHKRYMLGLLVGKYYSTREDAKAAKRDAWRDAEKICDDFVSRMIYDSRVGHSLFNHSVDNVSGLDISADFMDYQGDGSYAAVLYTFSIETFLCLDADGADFMAVGWLDL